MLRLPEIEANWLLERTWKVGFPPVMTSENPSAGPPRATIKELLHHTERGDFTSLRKHLDSLEAKDPAYHIFCDTIRVKAKRFDDDAIITFLSQ